jgi:hypothetical protein
VRCSRKQISKALLAANRLLQETERPAAKIAALLNPYLTCTEIEGATGQLHEDIRSGIFGVMGDAYRHEENVELAARWYRRASQISPGGHATNYAHIVCKHQLAEFYPDALKTLQEHQRRRLAKPIILRFVLCIWRWVSSERRKIARSERHDLKFLLQHAVSTPVNEIEREAA